MDRGRRGRLPGASRPSSRGQGQAPEWRDSCPPHRRCHADGRADPGRGQISVGDRPRCRCRPWRGGCGSGRAVGRTGEGQVGIRSCPPERPGMAGRVAFRRSPPRCRCGQAFRVGHMASSALGRPCAAPLHLWGRWCRPGHAAGFGCCRAKRPSTQAVTDTMGLVAKPNAGTVLLQPFGE